MVILDTSIIIDHLRQPKGASHLVKFVAQHPKEVLCISIISVQELYEGQSTKAGEREKDLLATISPLKILSYSYDIATRAGQIMRDYDRPIEFADAAIAATSCHYKASLYTLNRKDFTDIPGIELV